MLSAGAGVRHLPARFRDRGFALRCAGITGLVVGALALVAASHAPAAPSSAVSPGAGTSTGSAAVQPPAALPTSTVAATVNTGPSALPHRPARPGTSRSAGSRAANPSAATTPTATSTVTSPKSTPATTTPTTTTTPKTTTPTATTTTTAPAKSPTPAAADPLSQLPSLKLTAFRYLRPGVTTRALATALLGAPITKTQLETMFGASGAKRLPARAPSGARCIYYLQAGKLTRTLQLCFESGLLSAKTVLKTPAEKSAAASS